MWISVFGHFSLKLINKILEQVTLNIQYMFLGKRFKKKFLTSKAVKKLLFFSNTRKWCTPFRNKKLDRIPGPV